MSFKEKAKAQFAESRTVETLVPIVVPEWDTTIYYWTAMTLAERREIYLLAKQDGDSTILDLEAMAVTLIIRARDSQGRRLFNKAERIDLLNEYSPDVMAAIVGAMNNSNVSVEDAEKN